MSNHEQLLSEAVLHLRNFMQLENPYKYRPIVTQGDVIANNQWIEANDFINSLDMKMDEANAKHQDVLREVSDQQCFKMSEVHNEKFPLQKCSPADFRVMINMMLSISLVLEGEL